jgi:hypothetical protein
MPRLKRDSHLYELAKLGAEARLRDLVREAKHLINLFPHLRDSFDKDELPVSFIIAKGSGGLAQKKAVRPRRRMSAAERRAVSARMKKYWAGRRKAAAKA